MTRFRQHYLQLLWSSSIDEFHTVDVFLHELERMLALRQCPPCDRRTLGVVLTLCVASLTARPAARPRTANVATALDSDYARDYAVSYAAPVDARALHILRQLARLAATDAAHYQALRNLFLVFLPQPHRHSHRHPSRAKQVDYNVVKYFQPLSEAIDAEEASTDDDASCVSDSDEDLELLAPMASAVRRLNLPPPASVSLSGRTASLFGDLPHLSSTSPSPSPTAEDDSVLGHALLTAKLAPGGNYDFWKLLQWGLSCNAHYQNYSDILGWMVDFLALDAKKSRPTLFATALQQLVGRRSIDRLDRLVGLVFVAIGHPARTHPCYKTERVGHTPPKLANLCHSMALRYKVLALAFAEDPAEQPALVELLHLKIYNLPVALFLSFYRGLIEPGFTCDLLNRHLATLLLRRHYFDVPSDPNLATATILRFFSTEARLQTMVANWECTLAQDFHDRWTKLHVIVAWILGTQKDVAAHPAAAPADAVRAQVFAATLASLGGDPGLPCGFPFT